MTEAKSVRRHARKPRRGRWVGRAAVTTVCALAGYMLVANINLNRDTTVTTNTRELIEKRQERADSLSAQIDDLSTKLDYAKQLNGSMTAWNLAPTVQDAGSGTMLPALEGPGISVELDDSQRAASLLQDSGSDEVNVNDFVVHQQDVEAVVNALWKGGAEAMTIQGVRVENVTAVRCVGNVLLLGGHAYPPPYTIQAIGPYEAMRQALADSPAIQLYLEYVKEDGLGWKVSREDSLHFDKATSAAQTLGHATLLDPDQLQPTSGGQS